MRRLLHVDLSTGGATVSTPDAEEFRQYAGGSLLALRTLLAAPAGLGPYAPAAPLVFASSVVAGLRYAGLPRFSVVAKSPLTGGLGESRAEGPWGPALKASGAEALVLTGRAAQPCYLLVAGGQARLEPAAELWGADTGTATDRLRAVHGADAHVAVIGPAGERLVRYASIVTDRYFAVPRMGLGAVMGAKNLKAVVLVGGPGPGVPAPRPAELADMTAAYAAGIPANPQTRVQYESPGFGAWIGGDAAVLTGYLGVLNYRTSRLPDLTGFAPDRLRPHLTWSAGGCPGCPNDCIKGYATDAGEIGLHQEALAALGPNLGIGDEQVVLELAGICQRDGLDPVSLGFTLSWLLECVQAGLVPAAEPGVTGFGDVAGVRELVRAITARSGAGGWLAEGVARAASRFGPAAQRLALHSKGLELVSFDPRASAGQGLAYAVSPIGPRYDIVEHDIDFDPVDGHGFAVTAMRPYGLRGPLPMAALDVAKVRNTKVLLDMWSALDALNVCPYAGPPVRLLTLPDVAAMVSAATGWNVTEHEVLRWGQRRLHLARLYNLREGLTAADDRLPERFHTEPIDAGRHAGAVLDPAEFAAARALYYAMSGWDADGVPLPSTLADHDLEGYSKRA